MHENPDDPATVTPRENPDGSVTVTSHENPDGSVTVTPCEDGPLLLRGAFTILTQEGRSIDPGRTTVALCRCGRSATKPFCDGSHKAAGFRASSEPDSPS
ncbi:CDGSH iron-sulfur domain-containing protein [Streptosporangium subroseum]|uniref:CDGSH iron-sulfur domain-containing protein n=1 Tax=Streptosporangium subroseum TaxID=106412 RepID=UPI0034473141